MEKPNTYHLPLFESSQILSHQHLNDLRDYLDQENRDTRTELIGTGIACGLTMTVSLSGTAEISIDAGYGITSAGLLSDRKGEQYAAGGYLIGLSKSYTFTHFKAYTDPADPGYGFGKALASTETLTLFELQEDDDPLKEKPLAEFELDHNFEDYAVVLYLEQTETNLKSCTGTNCDNKGKRHNSIIRALLVQKAKLQTFDSSVYLMQEEAGDLPFLSIPRLSADQLETTEKDSTLRKHYYKIVSEQRELLYKQIERIDSLFGPLLTLRSNGSAEALENLKTFGDTTQYYQYAYDALRDITRAYNEFADAAAPFLRRCGMRPEFFPLHLQIGELVQTGYPDPYRTTFLNVPPVDMQDQRLLNAQLLYSRMLVLINAFEEPVKTGLRITPSKFYPLQLTEWSMPSYYNLDAYVDFIKLWNPQQYLRGREYERMGYYAPEYKPPVPFSDPFGFDITPYDFLRIEGVAGLSRGDALKQVEELKRKYNLAFRTITLQLERGYTPDDDCLYTDLQEDYTFQRHKLLNVIRTLREYYNTAKPYFFKDLEGDGSEVAKLIDKYIDEAFTRIGNALPRCLNHFNYQQFRDLYKEFLERIISAIIESDLWKNEKVSEAISKIVPRGSGEENEGDAGNNIDSLFSLALSLGSRMIFGLINGLYFSQLYRTHYRYQLRKSRRPQEPDKFSLFAQRHPGMEHLAGAPKGGTFILVCASKPSQPDKSEVIEHRKASIERGYDELKRKDFTDLIASNFGIEITGIDMKTGDIVVQPRLPKKKKISYDQPYPYPSLPGFPAYPEQPAYSEEKLRAIEEEEKKLAMDRLDEVNPLLREKIERTEATFVIKDGLKEIGSLETKTNISLSSDLLKAFSALPGFEKMNFSGEDPRLSIEEGPTRPINAKRSSPRLIGVTTIDGQQFSDQLQPAYQAASVDGAISDIQAAKAARAVLQKRGITKTTELNRYENRLREAFKLTGQTLFKIDDAIQVTLNTFEEQGLLEFKLGDQSTFRNAVLAEFERSDLGGEITPKETAWIISGMLVEHGLTIKSLDLYKELRTTIRQRLEQIYTDRDVLKPEIAQRVIELLDELGLDDFKIEDPEIVKKRILAAARFGSQQQRIPTETELYSLLEKIYSDTDALPMIDIGQAAWIAAGTLEELALVTQKAPDHASLRTALLDALKTSSGDIERPHEEATTIVTKKIFELGLEEVKIPQDETVPTDTGDPGPQPGPQPLPGENDEPWFKEGELAEILLELLRDYGKTEQSELPVVPVGDQPDESYVVADFFLPGMACDCDCTPMCYTIEEQRRLEIPPLAQDDFVLVRKNSTVDIYAELNDVDLLDNALEVAELADKQALFTKQGVELKPVERDKRLAFLYQPKKDFTGVDSFRYTVRNRFNKLIDKATVWIFIADPRRPASISMSKTSVCRDENPLPILLEAEGWADDELSVSGPGVSGSGKNWTFDPKATGVQIGENIIELYDTKEKTVLQTIKVQVIEVSIAFTVASSDWSTVSQPELDPVAHLSVTFKNVTSGADKFAWTIDDGKTIYQYQTRELTHEQDVPNGITHVDLKVTLEAFSSGGGCKKILAQTFGFDSDLQGPLMLLPSTTFCKNAGPAEIKLQLNGWDPSQLSVAGPGVYAENINGTLRWWFNPAAQDVRNGINVLKLSANGTIVHSMDIQVTELVPDFKLVYHQWDHQNPFSPTITFELDNYSSPEADIFEWLINGQTFYGRDPQPTVIYASQLDQFQRFPVRLSIGRNGSPCQFVKEDYISLPDTSSGPTNPLIEDVRYRLQNYIEQIAGTQYSVEIPALYNSYIYSEYFYPLQSGFYGENFLKDLSTGVNDKIYFGGLLTMMNETMNYSPQAYPAAINYFVLLRSGIMAAVSMAALRSSDMNTSGHVIDALDFVLSRECMPFLDSFGRGLQQVDVEQIERLKKLSEDKPALLEYLDKLTSQSSPLAPESPEKMRSIVDEQLRNYTISLDQTIGREQSTGTIVRSELYNARYTLNNLRSYQDLSNMFEQGTLDRDTLQTLSESVYNYGYAWQPFERDALHDMIMAALSIPGLRLTDIKPGGTSFVALNNIANTAINYLNQGVLTITTADQEQLSRARELSTGKQEISLIYQMLPQAFFASSAFSGGGSTTESVLSAARKHLADMQSATSGFKSTDNYLYNTSLEQLPQLGSLNKPDVLQFISSGEADNTYFEPLATLLKATAQTLPPADPSYNSYRTFYRGEIMLVLSLAALRNSDTSSSSIVSDTFSILFQSRIFNFTKNYGFAPEDITLLNKLRTMTAGKPQFAAYLEQLPK